MAIRDKKFLLMLILSNLSNAKLYIGTSAQEIQKIYPDFVTENEDRILSVDYARLSIIALAAIKELKKEIDELKNKIKKGRVNTYGN